MPNRAGRLLEVRLDHPEEVPDLVGQQVAVLETDPLGRSFEVDVDPSIFLESISTLETRFIRRRRRRTAQGDRGRRGEGRGQEQDGQGAAKSHRRGPPTGTGMAEGSPWHGPRLGENPPRCNAAERRTENFSEQIGCSAATLFYGNLGRVWMRGDRAVKCRSGSLALPAPRGKPRDEFADTRRLRWMSSERGARPGQHADRVGLLPILRLPARQPAQWRQSRQCRDCAYPGVRWSRIPPIPRRRSTGPRPGRAGRSARSVASS